MLSQREIINLINQATGTTAYHKFSSFPNYPVITDGVQALAEAVGCYWLLDIIGSHQRNPKLDKNFQVWSLEVNQDESTGVVRGYNDDILIITQKISHTDFPLDKIKFYLIDGVILLPSEY